MTPEAMAATHARAFSGHGRTWGAAEIADLLTSRHVFAVGNTHAFALGRVVADEAELLTIATDPDHRRKGLARAVLTAFERQAAARGAARLFLEVAADNAPALQLYQAAGYAQTGQRKGYYQRADARVDALILEKAVDRV